MLRRPYHPPLPSPYLQPESDTPGYILGEHSGTDIGIHEERGIFFRAFFRLGQFQAGHSQPGIQRELHLSVGIGVRGGHQMEFLYSHTFLKRLCHGIQAVLYGDRGIGHRRLSAFESCRWQLHAV